MDERLDRHGLLCVISRDILEDLWGCEGFAILEASRMRSAKRKLSTLSVRSHLVITDEPDSRGLIVLVIGDHNVIRPDLQEIRLERVRLTM